MRFDCPTIGDLTRPVKARPGERAGAQEFLDLAGAGCDNFYLGGRNLAGATDVRFMTSRPGGLRGPRSLARLPDSQRPRPARRII